MNKISTPQRWLTLPYYLYCLRLAALGRFYFIQLYVIPIKKQPENRFSGCFFILTMRCKSPYITLEEICKRYLPHITDKKTIQRKANEQSFPFPVFKIDKGNKRRPYLVKITDLAFWLDSQAEAVRQEWKQAHH